MSATKEDGDTALHLAALRKKTDVVRLLIEKKSDLTSRNTRRGQPLHAAAASGSADAVGLLLDAGADIESEMANAERALHLASFAGHDDVAVVLLDRGAEVDVRLAAYGSCTQSALAHPPTFFSLLLILACC